MINIKGYVIQEEIFQGANSSVYRALRQSDNQSVILKRLREDYATAAELLRYRQEYAILKSLSQTQGVIHAHGLEQHQNMPFLILEDFDGQSLRQLYAKQSLTIPHFLSLASQFCEILAEVHTANIIHKDINPGNFLLNPTTQQLKLIDFGIATCLPRENPILNNPEHLEGTLPYLSPEQTGRMNRSLDYRTDLYSLGVTYYELLTGQLPFDAVDPLEIVHSHIAKSPRPLNTVNPHIPKILSDIVIKLMAKNADDRYQSALGVKHDLEICLTHLDRLSYCHFDLAQQDISGKFHLPQQLYGREKEIEILWQVFERVSQGLAELLLIAGYSGIGKTALVQELYKPMTAKRGNFIAGKFDQFQRNVPYSAVVSAFRNLIQQLLTTSATQLAQWQKKLKTALGPNGQVIVDIIPEIELIIGEQPVVPTLSPVEAQTRFNLVFQNFIKIFCAAEHPLVIFLDDLQWADAASLQLLTVMMNNIPYLLVIGAYRDNEVSATHPLMITLAEIQKTEATLQIVTLSPLSLTHVTQFIADSFNLSITEEVTNLAQLLSEKTGGNPFFLGEFIKTLYSENLIWFDYQQRKWQWDVTAIYTRNLTDNVVELMAAKIQQLDSSTQHILKFAASLGNHFELNILASVANFSIEETQLQLWEAVSKGLLLILQHNHYKFVHDRIQQAAYFLIAESEKTAIHLQIGRLLLQHASAISFDEHLFEIVAQLNLGYRLMEEQEERRQLVALNLLAGRKAMNAMAYRPALEMFKYGLAAIPGNAPWETDFELTFGLCNELALCEYRSGLFEDAEEHFQALTQYAKTPQQIGKVYGEAVYLQTSMNHYATAIELARQGLARLGMKFPKVITKEVLAKEFRQAKTTLNNRQIADLKQAPVISDLDKVALFDILNMAIPSTWLAMPTGFAWCTLQMVKLSHQYGNTTMSAFGFGIYAQLLCGEPEEYQIGWEYGELAIALNQQFPDMFVRGTVHYFFNCFVQHWHRHKRWNVPVNQIAHQSCTESGANVYGVYNVIFFFFQSFCSELMLTEVVDHYKKLQPFVESVNDQDVLGVLKALLQLTATLQQEDALNTSFLNDEQFDEASYLSQLIDRSYNNGLCYHYLSKLFLAFFSGHFEQAIHQAEKLQPYYVYLYGLYQRTLYHFYTALSLTARYDKLSVDEQNHCWQTIQTHYQKLANWATHCPENYQHQFVLVSAEIARIKQQNWEAITLYEQAIQLTIQNEVLVHQALANELTAKFYFTRQLDKVAKVYLSEAIFLYQRWGANAKVKQLQTQYPQLFSIKLPNLLQTQVGTSFTSLIPTTISRELDIASIVKASQALSKEIVLSQLLENIMNIVIENAGAERGFLLLPKRNKWLIEAEGYVGQSNVSVLQSVPIDDNQLISSAIVYYVIRTQQPLVLDNASKQGLFIHDPHIIESQVKSVLVIPLKHQNVLTGMLYLENNLAANVFTANRIETLNVISSQAAISIENALLYTDLSEKNKLLRASELKFRALFDSANDAILLIENEKFINCNPKTLDIFRCRREWIIGQPPHILSPSIQPDGQDSSTKASHLINSALAGNPQLFEWVHIQEDGTPFDTEISLSKVEVDESVYLQVIIRDISERKQAEANKIRLIQAQEAKEAALCYTRTIEEKNSELIQLNQDKNEFLGIAAHDLKNPLSAILGLANIMVEEKGELPSEEVLEYATLIEDSSSRMFNLITNLLDVNAIESGKTNMKLEHVDILPIIEKLVHAYIDRAKAKDITIEFQANHTQHLALLDQEVIHQVLDNLISNAIKYSPYHKKVIVKLLMIEDQIRCEIQDEGPGLSQADQQKLFGKFTRLTTKPTGGEHSTGLGLFIVKKLVMMMNGNVGCESELGQGATFFVSFLRVNQ